MKLEEIVRLLKKMGYTVESDGSKSFEVNGEVFKAAADAIALVKDTKFILVKQEETARPLTPLERRTVAIARLLGVSGFVILTNELETVFLDVETGKRVDGIPDASNATSKQINFDEEKEKRIVAAIDSIRCSCCESSCRLTD